MVFNIPCAVCNLISDDQFTCCSLGCGYFVHIKCQSNQDSSSLVCPSCTAKAPSGAQAIVLKRLAELTNIVLTQSSENQTLRSELSSCKTLLTRALADISLLKTMHRKPLDLRSRSVSASSSRHQMLLGASNVSSGNNGTSSSYKQTENSNARSNSLQLKRLSGELLNDFPENSRTRRGSVELSGLGIQAATPVRHQATVGTGGDEIPFSSVPPRSAQIFISRVSADTAVSVIYNYVSKISKKVISVHKLKTRPAYSSFVIKVAREDEAVLSDPQVWRSGMLIKPFFGHLKEDMVEDELVASTPVVNQVESSASPNGEDSAMT